jgi:hypothetical protein
MGLTSATDAEIAELVVGWQLVQMTQNRGRHPCSIWAQLYRTDRIRKALVDPVRSREDDIVFRAAVKASLSGRAAAARQMKWMSKSPPCKPSGEDGRILL